MVEHFHEKMDGLKVRQLVVVGIHADAEKQPRISTVHNFGASAKLDEIGLVFLISWGDKTMDLRGER